MSATATRPPRSAPITDSPATTRSAPRLFATGEVSLEDLVLRAWEGLARDGGAECLVCGARVAPGAGCTGCGSELS